MPLKKLNHRSTTKVSAYDRPEMKKTIFIVKPNGGIEIERPAKNRARSNTDQVSCKRRLVLASRVVILSTILKAKFSIIFFKTAIGIFILQTVQVFG